MTGACRWQPPAPSAFGFCDDLLVCDEHHRTVPHNVLEEVPFETELFKGKILMMFKVGNARGDRGAQALFSGRQRLIWTVIQGQFKRPGVSLDQLCLGSEFERPLRLPATYIVAPAVAWLAARMGGGLQIQPTGARPHVLAPLCAAAQIINVSLPGQEPSDMMAAAEDTRLLLGGDAPLPAARRRALFRSSAHRQGLQYDCGHVYTFHIYDHTLDYSDFRIPFFKLDMVKILDGQPLGFMIKDYGSGSSLMDLKVWHRRMLEHKPAAASPPPCTEAMQTDDKQQELAAGWRRRSCSTSSSGSCSSFTSWYQGAY